MARQWAANQANGVTEKACTAQCRGGAAPAFKPLPLRPHRRLPHPSRHKLRRQGKRLRRECREEWRASGQQIKPWRHRKGLRRPMPWRALRPLKPLLPPHNPPAAAPAPTATPALLHGSNTQRQRRSLRQTEKPPPVTAGPAMAFRKIQSGRRQFSAKLRLRSAAPSGIIDEIVNLTPRVYRASVEPEVTEIQSAARTCADMIRRRPECALPKQETAPIASFSLDRKPLTPFSLTSF